MPDRSELSNLLPKTMDDIIQKNRHLYSLRLSFHEELNTLPPMVALIADHRQVKAKISVWRFICWVRPEEIGGPVHFLLGINKARQRIIMTSDVRSVDFENGLVLTKNSLYRLGCKGNGDPEVRMLLHICATLHVWGHGEFMGIPHVFY